MEEFRWVNENLLYLYILLPVMVLCFYFMYRWKKNAINKFGQWTVIAPLFAHVSKIKPLWKFVFMFLAATMLITAICRPQLGSKLEEVKRKGVDIVICLDVSNSMDAEDLKPNRLERAKQAISQLVDRLQGDRIGLIVFAGESYTQLPITTDYGAAKLMLGSIGTDMIPTQGTAIGSAIDLAASSFGDSIKKHNAAIVVITDGENHEDDAIEAAKEAYKKGITVHTIGMGSVAGAPIPIKQYGQNTGYMQDESGQTVLTKLDENNLVQIADAGGGKFVRATTSDDGLPLIMNEIDKMNKKEFSSKMFTSYEEQFQWALIIALFFLIIEFLISERKSKWLEKLKLFEEEKPVV
nr:VWA domain-containing protein [Bacteroidota bacterium]